MHSKCIHFMDLVDAHSLFDIRNAFISKDAARSFAIFESKTCCPTRCHRLNVKYLSEWTFQMRHWFRRAAPTTESNPKWCWTCPAITLVLEWFAMKTRFIGVGCFFLRCISSHPFWFISISLLILRLAALLSFVPSCVRLNMIFHYERESFPNDYQLNHFTSLAQLRWALIACELCFVHFSPKNPMHHWNIVSSIGKSLSMRILFMQTIERVSLRLKE